MEIDMAKAPAPAKKPMGRPSTYKPEYCERIVQMAQETGAGPAEYAAEFDICRETLYDWKDRHPEFSTALKRAKIQELSLIHI